MPSRVLLTGFARFGEHAVNPSETLVRRFAAAPPRGLALRTLVLPVSYRNAFEPVRAEIERGGVDAVLMTGLAAGRSGLEFERFALNWRGAPLPDEDGVVVEGEPIDPAGPAAYLATLPVDELVEACRFGDVAARASSHAGTFLCNQVLYQTLRHLDRNELPVRAGFLHLPEPPAGPAGEEAERAVAAAVESALRRLAARARPRRAAAPVGTRRGARDRATPARLVRPRGDARNGSEGTRRR